MLLLQSDLRQAAGQQLVHIVIYAHGHLDELNSVRAGQALAICIGQGSEREKGRRNKKLMSACMDNPSINNIQLTSTDWPHWFNVPCVDTARERAKSILFAAKMTARLRNKSMSMSIVNICSARVKDALSTTEKMTRNASALSSSSWKHREGERELNYSINDRSSPPPTLSALFLAI